MYSVFALQTRAPHLVLDLRTIHFFGADAVFHACRAVEIVTAAFSQNEWGDITKNTAYVFLVKGVWPNPRMKKAKAVHTKVCTDVLPISFVKISGQTFFTMIDSSVKSKRNPVIPQITRL